MGLVLVVLIVIAAALAAVIAVALRNQRAGVTRRGDPAIDPFTVGEPWRRLVQGAVRSQSRYHETVALTRPGPLRDRLDDIGVQLDDAVAECWRIAQRGNELGDVLDSMHIAQTRDQLEAVAADTTDPSTAARADALRSRIATYDRIAATSAQTEQQLRLLVARLDETSARGAELSLATADTAGLAELGSDVTGVVDELEALRVAFDEVGPGRELGA